MNKLFVFVSLFIFVMLKSCKNSEEFSITGKVENAGEHRKVFLYETDQVVDSAFLNEDNEFKFRRVAPEPNFYTLLIGDKNFLLIAQNGDQIEFETNYSDTTNTYSVKGSDESEKIRDFNRISNDYGKINQQIQDEYSQKINANPERRDSIYNVLMPKFQENMNQYSQFAWEFVQKNKDNLAGFFVAQTIDGNKYEKELISYAEEIKTKFPKNRSVQSYVSRMMEIKKVSVGQMAPEFELPDPSGVPVSLSSFKGKYLLLDFWASWCAPCREENPNIVRQYQKYKDKGFEVLGVSLDDEKTSWLKAVKDDNLNWSHVSDLKRWDSEIVSRYKVESIPASFILDPSGRIIAKNLRGNELQEFLSNTIK